MDPIKGKNLILAFRRLSEEKTATGALLQLQVEHEIKFSNDVQTKMTKFGQKVLGSTAKYSLSVKGLLSSDPVNDMLEQAAINGETVEGWEIDRTAPVTSGKYKAKYFRVVFKDWAAPAPSDGFVEFSTNGEIEGTPKSGEVTLTTKQLDQIDYAFRDLTPVPSV